METTITKQQDVLNGNEAYLIGVNKLGEQVWLEVLNKAELKCEYIGNENIDLNNILTKKVFDKTDGNFLSALFKHYTSIENYIKRHPEDSEATQVIEGIVKNILDGVKPTI